MREGCSNTYSPLSIARYSFIQLSELEQCRVKKRAQCFNTAAQDSNPGSRSRESEAVPLSHCALLYQTQAYITQLSIYCRILIHCGITLIQPWRLINCQEMSRQITRNYKCTRALQLFVYIYILTVLLTKLLTSCQPISVASPCYC